MNALKTQAKNIGTCFFILSIVYFSLISCKKNELGGKSTIEGKVLHHSKAIAEATVYVKMGVTESPGDDISKYDFEVTADANGYFKLPLVQKGDYYLYAVGKDFSVPAPWLVKGGIPVNVRYKETKSVELPVTE
jgi:hypothetical protein